MVILLFFFFLSLLPIIDRPPKKKKKKKKKKNFPGIGAYSGVQLSRWPRGKKGGAITFALWEDRAGRMSTPADAHPLFGVGIKQGDPLQHDVRHLSIGSTSGK